MHMEHNMMIRTGETLGVHSLFAARQNQCATAADASVLLRRVLLIIGWSYRRANTQT